MHKQFLTVSATVLMAGISGCTVGIYPSAAGATDSSTPGATDSARPPSAGSVRQPADHRRFSINITGNGGQRTVRCAGDDVGISGHGMRIHITGACRSLTITGSGNQVEIAEVLAITINGYGNTAHWLAGPSGASPAITDNGEGNTVTAAKS